MSFQNRHMLGPALMGFLASGLLVKSSEVERVEPEKQNAAEQVGPLPDVLETRQMRRARERAERKRGLIADGEKG